uniref:NAD(+) kinase n=2 Tax=Arion vulgaris TaxID=1028688 RepID=A0A0B7A5A5_9EUPU
MSDSRGNKVEMSKPSLMDTLGTTVSFEGSESITLRDSAPIYSDVNSTTESGFFKKSFAKGFMPRGEIRYGRAVSQPEEPDEMRLARFRIGGLHEDNQDHESIVPSASARRTQRNSRRRTNHSFYGVSPHYKFGPKGFLVSSTACSLTIPDPSNQKLNWTKPPLTVLIIRKHLDESVLEPFRDLVIWLMEEKNMVVYVEKMVLEERVLLEDEKFHSVQDKLKSFKEGVDDLTDKVDFIICLGGDGTLLYVSSLFQASVPPVMAFNMGSLGFLTPFQFYKDFKHEVTRVMQGSASLLLRFRLKCVVITHEIQSITQIPHVKNIQKENVSLKTHKLVLNEVVVDRGSSSYLSNIDLYIEGRRVTTIQGDGLIISTPTGSTAYAVAAGASMIHPSVPCILITPICPHSLSFRPIVVPAGVEIKIMLSTGARGTAMVSFDGRDRQEIRQGDSLRITTASYPVPSVCAADQIEDWFDGLSVCLNWNLRLPQRPLHILAA